jgi:hypothetical protein
MPIAGTEAMVARPTVVIGALESERAEHALDGLAPAPGIARFATTGARGSWTHPIRGVGVEALLDDSSRQSQDLLPNREFERLQIQIFHCLATQQGLNLPNDVGGQQAGDGVFF